MLKELFCKHRRSKVRKDKSSLSVLKTLRPGVKTNQDTVVHINNKKYPGFIISFVFQLHRYISTHFNFIATNWTDKSLISRIIYSPENVLP